MDKPPFVESQFVAEDRSFEIPLRPASLIEFVGQKELCNKLEILVQASQARGEALPHILFSGPPGLGKTTLAHILAQAMGVRLVVVSGPVIEKAGDLAGVLTNLKPQEILFIDEIHMLNCVV